MSTFSSQLALFDVASPVTYTSTLNPLNQVTVNPGEYNLAFIFNSDASFQYSYTLSVTGVSDRGFVSLRANIDETVLLVLITEQGENRNQCEE